jgi:selenium-binding protein 1
MKFYASDTTPTQVATLFAVALAVVAIMLPTTPMADETCQSPYMPKIKGQEEYVYVWTLGVEGLGDESDKVVEIRFAWGSEHDYAFTATSLTSQLWLGGLDTDKIFVFDVKTDPGKPTLARTIDNFAEASGGVVGPHGHYALPGRMMISGLSNDKDHGGRTALVEYSNEGEHIATHWMPIDGETFGAEVEKVADGFGYDIRVLPRKNIMLTSSFTGWSNYMMDVGKVLQDEEAMKRFGQTVVLWNLHTREPLKVFDVPGSPLEIRFAWGSEHDYAFTATSLTSQLWLIYEDDAGEWQAKAVADIGDPAKIPMPVASRRVGMASVSTSRVRSFPVGTRRVKTTTSSLGRTRGMARNSTPPSPSTLPPKDWAGRI